MFFFFFVFFTRETNLIFGNVRLKSIKSLVANYVLIFCRDISIYIKVFDSLLHFRDLGFITAPCQEASVLVILYKLISEASSFKVDEIFFCLV